MAKPNKKYHIDKYIRFGDMPRFFIICRQKQKEGFSCVILASINTLRELAYQRRGFENPAHKGRLIFTCRNNEFPGTLKEILRARYDFDLESASYSEPRLF